MWRAAGRLAVGAPTPRVPPRTRPTRNVVVEWHPLGVWEGRADGAVRPQCPIVERLVTCLMFKGRNAGKKLMAVRIVKDSFEIIHLLTDQNPLQVLVQAIINAGPREDSTRIGSAGVVRRQAVDVSPFRRVNQALYLIAHGVRDSCVCGGGGATPCDSPLAPTGPRVVLPLAEDHS